jgi:2,5-furandicarboxylate decarboxylase 1
MTTVDSPTWTEERSLRSWLALLAERGELGEVCSEIEPDETIGAVLEHADGRCAVLFGDVAGARFPVVGNVVNGREHLALAMGCDVDELAERYADALERPVPWRELPAGDAPVLRNRLSGDRVLSTMPLAVQHEHDAGKYFTSALLCVRDPRSGMINLSINRMLAVGERELRVLLLPGRLRQIFTEAEEQGRDLDVAIAVGVDPLLVLASQAPADRDLDDVAVAGALHGRAVPVVQSPTIDALVPANAEFLIEGRIRAGVREPEGPFGEFPLTYGAGGPAPVIDVVDVWHRDTPVFQTILSGGREHFLAGGIPREAALLRGLRRAGFDVAQVRFPEGGSCRFHAVISIRGAAPGVATNVLLASFAVNPVVKHAVVVDDDVDVFDDEQVAWAVATRVQADRDVLVVPNSKGSPLDPSSDRGLGAKMGIDATVPAAERDRYARMRPPAPRDELLQRYLREAGLS